MRLKNHRIEVYIDPSNWYICSKLNDILICCQEYVYNTEVIKPANVNPEIHYNRLFYSKELSWFIVEIIPCARNTFYPLDPCLFYILDQILELIMSFRSFMFLTLIPSDESIY